MVEFRPRCPHFHFSVLSSAVLCRLRLLGGAVWPEGKLPKYIEVSRYFSASGSALLESHFFSALLCSCRGCSAQSLAARRWRIADVVSRCWKWAESQWHAMPSPLLWQRRVARLHEKFETSWNRCSNPCNILIVAYISKILASACSHSKRTHISLHNDFGLVHWPSKTVL